jgi:flagellar biosynthesis protein FlhG
MITAHGATDQADTLRLFAGRATRGIAEDRIRVISVTSGKGSVVVNLAESLTGMGKRMLVIDADLGMERMGDRSDFLLIDAGAGISAQITGFASAAREILLVVTPEPTSITAAYGLVKALSGRSGALHFRLLANMCRNAEEAAPLFRKLSAITERFLEVRMDYSGCIMHDAKVVASARRRVALCRLYPEAKGSLGFKPLAQSLTMEGAVGAGTIPIDAVVGRKEWKNHGLSS